MRELCSGEEAADATEYALMLSLVALAIVVSVGLFGQALATKFGGLTAELPNFDS